MYKRHTTFTARPVVVVVFVVLGLLARVPVSLARFGATKGVPLPPGVFSEVVNCSGLVLHSAPVNLSLGVRWAVVGPLLALRLSAAFPPLQSKGIVCCALPLPASLPPDARVVTSFAYNQTGNFGLQPSVQLGVALFTPSTSSSRPTVCFAPSNEDYGYITWNAGVHFDHTFTLI